MTKIMRKRTKFPHPARAVVLFLVLLSGLWVSSGPVQAALNYGQAYDDIGTFKTPWGNWCFWIGWDATFSETYTPANETYAWVACFAPEAIYVALQSGKGLYSAANVNVGLDYFYGALNLATAPRVSTIVLKDELNLSTNLLGVNITYETVEKVLAAHFCYFHI